jgi:protein-S-isoprenylcysteine O-methyltransferase Ste14
MEDNYKKLKFQILLKFGSAPFVLSMFFFLPAGTFNYWQAWVYIGVLCIPAIFVVLYFLKRDPDLLMRRSKMKEKEKEQKIITSFFSLFFIIIFLLPGFDRRYLWSDVPDWLAITSNIMVFLSYLLIVYVLKANSYAGRTVEIVEGHKVISTGPYSIVRHPMYTGVILMLIFTPFALGSYWMLLSLIPLPFALLFRILNEEKVLKRNLEGYKEYCKKIKWRLIPYIW